MPITEFPINTSLIENLAGTKQPNPGITSVNVSRYATGGTGTWADPYTGFETSLAAAFGPFKSWIWDGVFESAAFPNLGTHAHVRHICTPGTVFKYTGSGVALNFTATAPTVQAGVTAAFYVYLLGYPIIDGGGTATDGLFTQAIHHSRFEFGVRNVTAKRLHTRWAVGNKYLGKLTSRVGDSDGLGEETTNAVNGIYADHDGNPVNATQECEFWVIVEENSGDGIICQGANENYFAGTSEQNGGAGVLDYGKGNTFRMDNELNGSYDFYLGGDGGVLKNCLSTGDTKIGNDTDGGTYKKNQVWNGRFNNLEIDANAQHTLVLSPIFNYMGTGRFINNSISTMLVGAPMDYTAGVRPLALSVPSNSYIHGDCEFADDHGIIIRSPDGTRYRVIVANGGSLSTEVATIDLGLAESDSFSSAKTQWLKDSFVTTSPSSLVTVALASNQLSITLPNSTAGNNFAGYANAPHEIVSGGYEKIHYISKPASGSFQFHFSIGKSRRNCLHMGVDSGSLVFSSVAGGSTTSIASIAFNVTTMQYWRLRRSTNDIIAEYSQTGADGTWTTLGTATPTQFEFTNYRTCIEAGSTGSSTFSAPVVFDDYIYFRG